MYGLYVTYCKYITFFCLCIFQEHIVNLQNFSNEFFFKEFLKGLKRSLLNHKSIIKIFLLFSFFVHKIQSRSISTVHYLMVQPCTEQANKYITIFDTLPSNMLSILWKWSNIFGVLLHKLKVVRQLCWTKTIPWDKSCTHQSYNIKYRIDNLDNGKQRYISYLIK